MRKHKIIIVDDHLLVSNSLKKLIEGFNNFKVDHQLANGSQLVEHLKETSSIPDLILLDVNMPVMNGQETIVWLKKNHPTINVLVLSMDDDESTVIYMLRHGAKGYILKNSDPEQFKHALESVINKGFYHSERISSILVEELQKPNSDSGHPPLNDRELLFLNLACTEKTYKEIASEMYLSPKTIDGYRENLFKKLGVKSRIGLALFAIKNSIVDI